MEDSKQKVEWRQTGVTAEGKKRHSRNLRMYVLLPTMAAMMMSGCTSTPSSTDKTEGDSSPAKEEILLDQYSGDPVVLTVCDFNSGVREELFQRIFAKPINAKYPNISLKLSEKLCNSEGAFQELIASRTVPDIVLVSRFSTNLLEELQLTEDISDFIKKAKIDLGRLDPSIANTNAAPDGKVFTIPFAMNYGAMIYNKELFDRLAVPYPKETPTWNELLEISRKITRSDGQKNYVGLYPGNPQALMRQRDLRPVDGQTGKVLLTSNDGHRQVLSLLQQFYSVPGYVQNKKFEYYQNEFFKDQQTGAYVGWINSIYLYAESFKDQLTFDWDLTAHPAFDDQPKIGRQVDYHVALVTSSSRNKEAARLALAHLLTEEVQVAVTRSGRLSVLNDKSLLEQFAGDTKLFQGKNLAALFKVSPAPAPYVTKYDADAYGIINGEMNRRIALEGVDINTALREAEEKIRTVISTK